ncbi:hypothetical protein KMP13_06400 [Epibacterium ulvae]|uniref:hypothetical protein n=1 Tax=Epibacterium ulvae TaxID=1156985 RepID=UPI001BFC6085|nr:hypothetical protein [Epibacterium ulvae]MBT8153531.1 hypothetical protein [Epibacterium ulvae]
MDRHTRIIALLKVILPLTALALLSTVFLVSRGSEQDAAIPFAQKEIEERMRGQQVTRPFFAGSTPNGDEILVSADKARVEDSETGPTTQALSGIMRLADGGHISLKSETGSLSSDMEIAHFRQKVVVETDDGLRVETELLDAHLNAIAAEAPETVEATSPLGHLIAGSMHIKTESQGSEVHILFNKGVKLVYEPQTSER